MLLVVLLEIFARILTKFASDFSGFFAADYVAALDGQTVIPGGWLNHNWIQVAHQLIDCITGFSYSFGMTCIILFVMNLFPSLSLRASEDAEIVGIDEAEIGEFAYDFVERERDYDHSPIVEGSTMENASITDRPMRDEEKSTVYS